MRIPRWMIVFTVSAAIASSNAFADKTAGKVRGELHYKTSEIPMIDPETGIEKTIPAESRVMALSPVMSVEFANPYCDENRTAYGARLILTFPAPKGPDYSSPDPYSYSYESSSARTLTIYFSGQNSLSSWFSNETADNNLGHTRALKFKNYLERGTGKYVIVLNDLEQISRSGSPESVMSDSEPAHDLVWDAAKVQMKNNDPKSGKLFSLESFIDNSL